MRASLVGGKIVDLCQHAFEECPLLIVELKHDSTSDAVLCNYTTRLALCQENFIKFIAYRMYLIAYRLPPVACNIPRAASILTAGRARSFAAAFS